MKWLQTGVFQLRRAGLSLRNRAGICGWLLVLVFLCASSVHADTTWVAAGFVSGTWTASDSPYMIYDGWIQVHPDSTLQIDPGVRVYFDGPYILVVRGRLNANGTIQDSIVFTAPDDISESAWQGIFFDFTAQACSLRHCIFEHANGQGYLKGTGGAVQIRGSSPYFEHCVFRNNQAVGSRHGGGVYLIGSDAAFSYCEFTANDAGYIGLGGAVFCEDTTEAVFSRCVMRSNTAGSGGAVSLHHIPVNRYPRFIACELTQNYAHFNGGAVHVDSSFGSLISCMITENVSSQCGGAIYAYRHGNPLVEGCTISNNESFWGGGVYSCFDSHPYFWRCILDNNISAFGGALYAWRADAGFDFSTLAYNVSTMGDGAGVYLNESEFWSRHTIIAHSYGGEGVYFRDSAEAILQFCDIGSNSGGEFGFWPDTSGGPAGIGQLTRVNYNLDSCDVNFNILFDPEFVDGSAGDFHLNWTSLCIDAGDPGEEHWDPDGTRLDIGAFYRDITSADPERTALRHHELMQNYPNPFNSTTRISFDLPRASEGELTVYDLTGRLVTTLLSGNLSQGHHDINWDANSVPSGLYIYSLRAGDIVQAKKMIVLK